MHHGVGFLVLLDLDGPESLDSVLGLGVVVPSVRVDFCDAECEEGEWEEFEGVFGGGAVGYRGELRVLFACFGVFGGFEGADCAFYFCLLDCVWFDV